MVDFSELLGKAFGISKDTKFLVRIYENNKEILYSESNMTYLELGSKLIAEVNKIKRVDIYLKER